MRNLRVFLHSPKVQFAGLAVLATMVLIRLSIVTYVSVPDLTLSSSRGRLILSCLLSAVVLFMLGRFARDIARSARSQ